MFEFLKQPEKELLKLNISRVAVDTETHYVPDPNKVTKYLTKEDHPNNTPFLLTLSDGQNAWAVEMNEKTIPAVKEFLENSEIEKIFFNATFDIEMLLNEGIEVKGNIHDVMILHNLIDEEDQDEEGNYIKDLKSLSVKYLDENADKYDKQVEEERQKIAREKDIKKAEVSYYEVYKENSELMINYACADTLYTAQLFELWYSEVKKQRLERIYDIEMNCLWSVVQTEMRGHKVDYDRLIDIESNLKKDIESIKNKIFYLYGSEFNIDSDEQLVKAFMYLGAEYHNITEKGNWQTNKDALKPYIYADFNNVKNSADPMFVRKFASLVLKYRDENKTLDFAEGIKRYTQNGRVHPSFWLAGTRTGRMSSSKPNFQNITKKSKFIREVFVPSKDYIIVYFDWSQQEYKLLAHYAKEYKLIEKIDQGYDVHTATAAILYNIPYEEVTDEQRSEGKRMNFALVYGLGLAAIARNFGCPIDEDKYKFASKIINRLGMKPWELPEKETLLNSVSEQEEKEALEYFLSKECQEAIEFAKQKKQEYFAQFPKIAEFLKEVKGVCSRRGYIMTWTGRRKRYKDAKRDSYKAPNALIQGGCGDMLKEKAGQIQKLLDDKKSGIVNFVHDEIAVEIHLSELNLVYEIRDIMNDNDFIVPITTDINWTDENWNNQKSFKEFEEMLKEVG